MIVSYPLVPSPEEVRYAWQSNPTVALFNGAGLPASLPLELMPGPDDRSSEAIRYLHALPLGWSDRPCRPPSADPAFGAGPGCAKKHGSAMIPLLSHAP